MQTTIVMSISYIFSKEIPSEIWLCKSIRCQIQCVNCYKPEYRYVRTCYVKGWVKCIVNLLLIVFILWLLIIGYNRKLLSMKIIVMSKFIQSLSSICTYVWIHPCVYIHIHTYVHTYSVCILYTPVDFLLNNHDLIYVI